jgi:hypothetical protein
VLLLSLWLTSYLYWYGRQFIITTSNDVTNITASRM